MKNLIYLIIVVLFVGIWLGINIAQDQPMFSNPFNDDEVAEEAKQAAESIKRKAGETAGKVFKTD